MPILYSPENQVFRLQNDRISYIIRLVAGKYPIHQYWGKKVRAIHADVMERCCNQREEGFTLHEPAAGHAAAGMPGLTAAAICGRGCWKSGRPMAAARWIFATISHEILKGKPALKGLPSARGRRSRNTGAAPSGRAQRRCGGIELQRVYPDIDVIARNMRVVNGGGTARCVGKSPERLCGS